MPGPRPLRPGEPKRLGGYRLLARVGEGGQGIVYLAEDVEGTRVAIKVLHAHFSGDTQARERFLREADAATRVAPFCTARVLDVAVDEHGRPYVVSEYVEGVSLEELVRSQGPRMHGTLDRVAVGTATALTAIHKAGIAHRDFKPSNVLIGPDGPRVIDFGIARALVDPTTTQGELIGTPAYMSPEQISGRPVGTASDIFSWALTMAFAATGKAPFGEDTFPAVMYRIVNAEPCLDGVPEPLRSLLERCLDKSPERRPTSAEVLDMLLGHGESRDGASPPEPPDPPDPPTPPEASVAFPGADLPGGSASQIAYWPKSPTAPQSSASARRSLWRSRLGLTGMSIVLVAALGTAVWLVRSDGRTTVEAAPPAPTPSATARILATTDPETAIGATPASPPVATLRSAPFGTPVGPARTGIGAEVNTVAVSELGGRAVVLGGSTGGRARMWDLLTGRPAGTPLTDAAADIDVTEVDGAPAAFLRYPGGRIRPWNLATGKALGPDYTGHAADVYALAVIELNGRPAVVSGDVRGQLRFWDPRTGKDVGKRPENAHSAAVFGLAAGTVDGKPVALSAAADDVVRVWDPATGRSLSEFRGHTGDVFAVAATESQGTPIGVSGGADDLVRRWDLRNGEQIGEPLRGHTADVGAIAVGRLRGQAIVASGGFDGTIRVWNLDTGEPIGSPLRGHGDRVYSLAITEIDGRTLLVSGGRDRTVRVWSLGPASS
ncbi:serine/threonine-protein kinase [Thermopolyspora sp. NPDC052614]|uniref:WD40 repeat domain-containing serine/threonine protein kinase n=1 Tax=Thermopolyspora sp. NPDC052614 TaxID=3155682 RepID=UPI003436B59F